MRYGDERGEMNMQDRVPQEEHVAEEKLNWLRLATQFSSDVI